MPITRDEVAYLARLSRIALSDAELDHLAPQLAQIVTAVEQVQEVAAEGIPPTSHAIGLTNVFRDDQPTGCLTPEEALDQVGARGLIEHSLLRACGPLDQHLAAAADHAAHRILRHRRPAAFGQRQIECARDVGHGIEQRAVEIVQQPGDRPAVPARAQDR